MSPLQGIEAVLFDYGQVLSQGPNPAAWDRLQAITGGSAELFHQAYWASRHDYDRGTLIGSSYWQTVAAATGHPSLTADELDALYLADLDLWTDLNEPMVAWVHELHRRGVRTGILSNIGDQMEKGIRERFPWIDHFHHCTWSHTLRLAKPELEIYQHAARGLGVEPASILFVDDREENVLAARSAGMNALQYSTHEAFVAEIKTKGWADLL